jgi:hypothetical protein
MHKTPLSTMRPPSAWNEKLAVIALAEVGYVEGYKKRVQSFCVESSCIT